jgi:probable F420-dependent oxidoreductase
MSVGFHFPFSTIDLAAHAELAREIRDLGYEHVWTGENPGFNGFLPLVLASQWAPGIGLGCACFPVQTRGPGLFADSVAQLCELAPPGKVVIGIGSSSEFVVSRLNGRPAGKPLSVVRDMARFLKQAFTGEAVKADTESFRVRYKLSRPIEAPPRIMIAALRPKMIELAAAESDGVILNNIAPEDMPRILPHVRKHGAQARVAARVYVTPVEDSEVAREVAAASLAAYFPVPTYRKHQEWLGHTELYQPLWDASAQGGYYAAREAVTDEMIARTYLLGAEDFCRQRIQDYLDAGVDDVIVSPVEESMDPLEIARRLAPR